MALDVKSVWSGALTATSVRVVADTAPPTDGSLLVADNEAMTGAVTIGPVTATAEGILDFTVTGLDADTRYWYVVDAGGLNNSYQGTFRTHPGPVGERASYIFGAAGDAGLTGAGDDSHITNAVSNNPVFDTMTAQAAAEDWVWFSHLGDLHYRNIATNDPALFRAAYDDNFNYNLGFNPDARQGTFLRGQAVTYVWDDHDYGPNNSDRTAAGNPAANQVYRECVPHYPLAGGTTGIHQAWQVGRVLYIASDVRSFRDPNGDPQDPAKTMLGTAQRAWMEALLATARESSGAQALVWQSPSRWIGGSDTWSSFLHERDQMVQLFGDTGWLDRMIMLTADEHALGISSGPNNPFGAFPMFMLASMDSGFTTATDDADQTYNFGRSGGRQRYGTVRVQDNGHTIALTGTGYIDGTPWRAHTAYVHVGSPVIALDYKSAHISPPFEPTKDDQRLRNKITAKRDGGGEYTYALEEGRRSVQDPPNGSGLYEEDVTVDVADDEQLPGQAAWRVALGTVNESRYPSVTIDLRRNPGLADDLTGLYLGDKLTIERPPPNLPPDLIQQLAEGGTETLSVERWQVELNAAPASPYTVAQLPAPQTLAHGTFETDLTGWTPDNATIDQIASPGQPPFGGAWSAQITPNGTSGSGGINANPATAVGTIIPGERYIASCWVYSPGGWSDLGPAINWFNAAGGFLSSSFGGSAVAAGVWTQLAATYTAPANASRASVRARHGGTPSAGDIWSADEVLLQETGATPLGAGPNRPNRLDTSGCELVAAVDDDDTELILHTPPDGVFDRAPWIISEGLADAPNLRPTHFPLDLRLGGETVRATACEPLAWDAFTRTETDTWGTADSGHAWSPAGGVASDFSVNGTQGLITLQANPATIRHQQILETLADTEILVSITPDQTATGSAFLPAVLLRAAGDYYRCRLLLETSGAINMQVTRVTTVIGATAATPWTYSPGTKLWLRVRITGQRVLGRVWPDTVTEPVHRWYIDRTVVTDPIAAGAVGVTGSAFGGNTNVNPQFAFDDFQIVTPQQATVTRSINTVTKPHTAGSPVSLAQPARLAL